MNDTTHRILIVAHTPLASALRDVAAHLFADAASEIAVVDVQRDDDAASVVARMKRSLEAYEAGAVDSECTSVSVSVSASGVLVLADIPGATPHNAARAFVDEQPELRAWISGISVPMVLRSWSHRNQPFLDFCQSAVQAGPRCIQTSFTLPETGK